MSSRFKKYKASPYFLAAKTAPAEKIITLPKAARRSTAPHSTRSIPTSLGRIMPGAEAGPQGFEAVVVDAGVERRHKTPQACPMKARAPPPSLTTSAALIGPRQSSSDLVRACRAAKSIRRELAGSLHRLVADHRAHRLTKDLGALGVVPKHIEARAGR